MECERNKENSLITVAILTLLNIFLETIESGFILNENRYNMKEWRYEKGSEQGGGFGEAV
jgi:hypothetical protein